MGFCLLVSEIIYYEDVGYLAVFGNLRPVDEERVSVPSISLITWSRCTILFSMALLHFSFSGPLLGVCTF